MFDASGGKRNEANRIQDMKAMINMEEVDLSKSGKDTLKISLSDLEKNHDATHNRLIIKGDSADTIRLGTGLDPVHNISKTEGEIDGKNYKVYTYQSDSGEQYHLYIDQTITSII